MPPAGRAAPCRRRGRDVVDDPDAVAETLGARELKRLPDRRQAEGLARVDRDVEVLLADVLERVEVARRRVALLGSGDIEADDARVAPADGALGDLDRAGRLAHRGHEHLHHDRAAGCRGPFQPDPEPLEVRLERPRRASGRARSRAPARSGPRRRRRRRRRGPPRTRRRPGRYSVKNYMTALCIYEYLKDKLGNPRTLTGAIGLTAVASNAVQALMSQGLVLSFPCNFLIIFIPA